MTDLERAKHDAALALQRFVNNRVEDGGLHIKIRDPEAVAVVESISAFVIKTIEHFLSQPVESADERSPENGE